jgi:hypothetical protein
VGASGEDEGGEGDDPLAFMAKMTPRERKLYQLKQKLNACRRMNQTAVVEERKREQKIKVDGPEGDDTANAKRKWCVAHMILIYCVAVFLMHFGCPLAENSLPFLPYGGGLGLRRRRKRKRRSLRNWGSPPRTPTVYRLLSRCGPCPLSVPPVAEQVRSGGCFPETSFRCPGGVALQEEGKERTRHSV